MDAWCIKTVMNTDSLSPNITKEAAEPLIIFKFHILFFLGQWLASVTGLRSRVIDCWDCAVCSGWIVTGSRLNWGLLLSLSTNSR